MMRTRLAVALLSAAVVATSVARGAEGDPPCLADIERLCRLVPGTGSFIQGCLELQYDELSPECRKHVGETTDDSVKIGDACESDIDRFCSDRDPGGGQRVSCLLENRDRLSSRCRDVFDKLAARDEKPPKVEPVPEGDVKAPAQ